MRHCAQTAIASSAALKQAPMRSGAAIQTRYALPMFTRCRDARRVMRDARVHERAMLAGAAVVPSMRSREMKGASI